MILCHHTNIPSVLAVLAVFAALFVLAQAVLLLLAVFAVLVLKKSARAQETLAEIMVAHIARAHIGVVQQASFVCLEHRKGRARLST